MFFFMGSAIKMQKMDDDGEMDFYKTLILSEWNQILLTLFVACIDNIIEYQKDFGWKNALGHEVLSSLRAGLTLDLDQDAQGPVQGRFENLQRWKFHGLSEHLVPAA